ncbi:MAG TPA: hypothetical protein VF642_11315, partial [Propionibacteriaceae bacterium]
MAKPSGKKPSGQRRKPSSRSGSPTARAARPGSSSAAGTASSPARPAARGNRPARPSSAIAVLPDDLEVLPVDGVAYPQILRTTHYQWWRSLAGASFGIALFLLMSAVVSQAVVAVAWLVSARGTAYATYVASAFRFERP